MLNKTIFLIAIFCLFETNAQIPVPEVGECVVSPIISDFDPFKYSGKWYEIERSNVVFENDEKCTNATYKVFNATAVSVDNESLNKKTGKKDTISGYASIDDITKPNYLLVHFPGRTPGDYIVWRTDYNSYSLVYSCTQVIPKLLKVELIWILSKVGTQLDPSIVQDLKSQLEKNGVKISKFVKSDNENC